MRLLSDDIIRLRAVEPDDAVAIWIMEMDSEQWIYNGMAAPYSLNNLIEYSRNYDSDPFKSGQLKLIIEKIEDKAIIGTIDLYDISSLHQTAFIGIYIDSNYRNKGYALKAITLIEEYCLNLLNLHQLAARIMSTNTASVMLFKKAQYTLRGTIPEWYKSGKTRPDLLLYSKIL